MDGIEPEPSGTRTSVSPSSQLTLTDSSFRYEDSSTYTTSTMETSSSHEICSGEPRNPYFYAYSEICAATRNFHLKHCSPSKDTWRCHIRKDEVVVVGRKHRRSQWQIEDTLSTICQSHHPNIVKLLGASISGDYIFLVYDYVSGINFFDLLRDPKISNHSFLSLTWEFRFRIVKDIVEGLEHIHHYVDSNVSLVHNNLSSSSVILSGPFFNKTMIYHFDTAELSGEISRDQMQDSGIEGRSCYMAPELINGEKVSQKSDVFALGVLLLEILSGDEPVKEVFDEEILDYRKISLIDSARDAIESREIPKILQWIDNRIWDPSQPTERLVELVEKIMHVGLECVHVQPDKRPDMRCVALKIRKLGLLVAPHQFLYIPR